MNSETQEFKKYMFICLKKECSKYASRCNQLFVHDSPSYIIIDIVGDNYYLQTGYSYLMSGSGVRVVRAKDIEYYQEIFIDEASNYDLKKLKSNEDTMHKDAVNSFNSHTREYKQFIQLYSAMVNYHKKNSIEI